MPAVLCPDGFVAPVALGVAFLVDLLLVFLVVLGAVLGVGGVGSGGWDVSWGYLFQWVWRKCQASVT